MCNHIYPSLFIYTIACILLYAFTWHYPVRFTTLYYVTNLKLMHEQIYHEYVKTSVQFYLYNVCMFGAFLSNLRCHQHTISILAGLENNRYSYMKSTCTRSKVPTCSLVRLQYILVYEEYLYAQTKYRPVPWLDYNRYSYMRSTCPAGKNTL